MTRDGAATSHSGRDEPPSPVGVKCIYGIQAQQPLVELTAGHTAVQLEYGEAIDLGMLLVQTAIASRADAFVFDFARTELGVDDLAAALMLRKFREWRPSGGVGTSAGATGPSSDSTGDIVTDASA